MVFNYQTCRFPFVLTSMGSKGPGFRGKALLSEFKQYVKYKFSCKHTGSFPWEDEPPLGKCIIN